MWHSDDVLMCFFFTVQIENPPYFSFQFILPNDLEHVTCCAPHSGDFTKFEVGQPIRSCRLTTFTGNTSHHAVTLTFEPLTLKIGTKF